MSDHRMTCPGCNAYTSDTWNDFMNGDPCRFCGLPHEAMVAIVDVRRKVADEKLTAAYEEAITRATKAEAQVATLTEKLEAVRYALGAD